jgi:predicted ribosomally synthesized peptide with SipW-like signal peptide
MKTKIIKLITVAIALASSVGAAGVLTIGATNALFGATETSATNTFAAGTVSVAAGTPSSVTCAVTGMVPGDSSAGYGSGSESLVKCSYKVKYTGTSGAWLGVDVNLAGGTPNLYTGTATGLQLKVSVNGSAAMVNGTTYKTAAGVDTTVVSGTPVTNLLINTVQAVQNDEFSIDVTYALPIAAPNALQGGTSSLALTFHAIQSANNPIGTCAVNKQCSTITWS